MYDESRVITINVVEILVQNGQAGISWTGAISVQNSSFLNLSSSGNAGGIYCGGYLCDATVSLIYYFSIILNE